MKQYLASTLDGDRIAGRPWDLESDWSSAKDGKSYSRDPDPKWMRK